MNTLVNADYYGRQGIVIQKYLEKFVFENPGSFRIPLQDAFDGGTSDPRNATILKMFSMIDIGERAGSGIPGIVSIWEENFKSKPLYEQTSNPSRVTTTLDISEYVALDEEASDNGELQAINESSSDKSSDKAKTSAINADIGDKIGDKSEKSAINYKDKILEYLKENLEARSQDIALYIGLKQSRTKDYLSELVEEGKIVANGANKNRTYSRI
ncbi:ATP-binding protein [uncultured Treponema sp.]|uniref:ATP-binding protein n=1 Tax=uncultured Treponema sp. TaxID=162155 RepID=UPI0025D6E286|nr:ATP-binding protein [uncultured Treponema sp.]